MSSQDDKLRAELAIKHPELMQGKRPEMMTGSEWFDRFEQAIDVPQNWRERFYRIHESYLAAARRAAGIEETPDA